MLSLSPLARRSALIAATTLLSPLPPAGATTRATIRRAPLLEAIGAREVAFLARDLGSGTEQALEDSDLASRHAPWSSFKIPNLLIALETGVAAGLDAPRRWDPARRPALPHWPAAWRRDHTLGSAFEDSAVWYFQDVAAEVGAARYRSILTHWRYGNAAVSDGSDSFWLGGGLSISVSEQVAFLAELLGGRLGVSQRALRALAQASRSGQVGTAVIHGKTGSGPVTPGAFGGLFEGWYCGFVVRPPASPVVFALFTRAPGFASLAAFRREFSLRLLAQIGVLPEPTG
ncbi:class D beta-lactamase [Roseomonas rosulenta]|uniref:class D beta-lactamase n=1 Tax=Roseomonas rosulenta TaxID=2748667 RepID=UPI0018DF87A7|nr:class D beta-lactamase [Roseomonas rosulenta]